MIDDDVNQIICQFCIKGWMIIVLVSVVNYVEMLKCEFFKGFRILQMDFEKKVLQIVEVVLWVILVDWVKVIVVMILIEIWMVEEVFLLYVIVVNG